MAVSYHVVTDDEAGWRLDRLLRHCVPQATLGQIQQAIRTGQVRLDGKRCQRDTRVIAGQQVRLPPQLAMPVADQYQTAPLIQQPRQLEVLFHDAHMLVLNKPYGLAVQGGSGQKQHIEGLLYQWLGQGVFLVHRLDKETTGVLVVARTRRAARILTAVFRQRTAQKIYWAMTMRPPPATAGMVDAPLSKTGEVMRVDPARGLPASTMYQVVQQAASGATWLSLYPQEGRTHQLRVHCQHLGCPIVGDSRYGDNSLQNQNKMHLHARQLRITHPDTGEACCFVAPLPQHMRHSWHLNGWDSNDTMPL